MKRILVYGMSSNIGGVEEYLMNIYKNIDRTSIQFDFIITYGNKVYCEEKIIELGGNIFYLDNSNFLKRMISLKKVMKQQRKNHNTVYFNTCGIYNIIPYIYAKIYKYKNIIVHAHNTKDTSKSELVHAIHKSNRWIVTKFIATRFLACSEAAGKWIFGRRLVENNKIDIIYNSINIEKFRFNKNIRNKIRKELNLEDKLVIGHVGRFIYQKNQIFLIHLLAKITQINKNVALLLIGEGIDKEKIENEAKKCNVYQYVKFLGTKKNVNEYMFGMDVFAFPSIYEGLGIVAIEAQASGLKVIASNNVPVETRVTDLISFVDLENIEKWYEEIMNFENSYDREKYYYIIRKTQYNIKNQKEKLQKLFSEEK